MKFRKTLAGSTIMITSFSIIGIIISFLSQLIIAYFYGATFYRDAYFIALTIPVFVSAIITGSFGYVFLPKITELKIKRPEDVNDFINSSFTFFILFLTILTIILLFLSTKIIFLLIPNYTIEEKIFVNKILFIILPTIISNVISNILCNLYQIENKFSLTSITPIFSTVINIAIFLLLKNNLGISALAIGYLIGSVFSCILLSPILKKYKFSFTWPIFNLHLINILKISLPLLLAGLFFRSTTIFERVLASKLEKGSVSYLGYSSQILAILATITSNGIGTSIYPKLSRLWTNQNLELLGNYINKSIRIILLVSIPISFYIFQYSFQIIHFIFQRGAFTENVTMSVSKALSFSMGAFIFQGIGTIISKLFYITGKTRIFSFIGIIEILLYISLSYFLLKDLSFLSLSFSLSLSTFLSLSLSMFYIHKKIIQLSFKKLFTDFSKILIASLVFISVTYLLNNIICNNTNILILVLITIFSSTLFLITSFYLKIEEIVIICTKIKNYNSNI
jgi:putative peptidoglycan lipid II flippase